MKRNRLLNGCWIEFLQRVKSIRFLSAIVLVVALVAATTVGIDQLMLDKQEWITPWLFPNVTDNVFFITLYGFIVCYTYSDVPFMQRTELYKILRKGKKRWCVEKLIAIALQALFMTILAMGMTILIFLPRVQLDWDWGKVIYTLAYSDVVFEYNIVAKGSAAIIIKYEPIQAMLISFLLLWLETTLMGVFMFGLSLYTNRTLAVTIAIAMISMQFAVYLGPLIRVLVYVMPFYWCRMSIHGEQAFLDIYYPPLPYCLIVSVICLILCITASMLRIRRKEFIWNNEE